MTGKPMMSQLNLKMKNPSEQKTDTPVTLKKGDSLDEAKRLCDDWAVKKAATLTSCPRIGANDAQAAKYGPEEGQEWSEVLRDADDMAARARKVDLALMRCFPGNLWGAASRLLFLKHHAGIVPAAISKVDDIEKRRLLEAVFGSANRAIHTLYKELG